MCIILTGYIQGEGLCLTSASVYLVDHPGQLVHVASGDDDQGSFAGEGEGNGASYSPTGAGDQRYFMF
jgi:hypothetical protein